MGGMNFLDGVVGRWYQYCTVTVPFDDRLAYEMLYLDGLCPRMSVCFQLQQKHGSAPPTNVEYASAGLSTAENAQIN